MNRTPCNISYTTESMEKLIKKYNGDTNLLPLYLDRIRNGYGITQEMLEHIELFDHKSKMKIIREYNRCYKIISDSIKG